MLEDHNWMYGVMVVVQLICIVHAVRRQRDYYWIFIILFLPPFGALIYAVLYILPTLRGGGGLAIQLPGHQQRVIRQLERDLAETDTVQIRSDLAELYLRYGRAEDARAVMEPCIDGPLRDAQHVLYVRVAVAVANAAYHDALSLLDRLNDMGSNHKRKERELLQARSLWGLQRYDEAETIFKAIHRTFSGEEAAYYFVQFLIDQNRIGDARSVVDHMRSSVQSAGSLYRRQEVYWLRSAQGALREAEKNARDQESKNSKSDL
jgi:hypothetical protein